MLIFVKPIISPGMKDFTIPASRVRTELWSLAVCFGIAVLINLGSIIYYHTPFYEIFTQIGYTVVVTVILYVVWILLRLLVLLIRKAFRKA